MKRKLFIACSFSCNSIRLLDECSVCASCNGKENVALKKLQACGEFTQVYEAVKKDASR
jgi:hypothetical protein